MAHAMPILMASAVLRQPGGLWELRSGSRGQPYLLCQRDSRVLHVGLSHTRSLAACVLSASHDVGIDVEARDAPALRDAGGGWLTAAERDLLHDLAHEARADAAVRLWTLKEAFAKAMGLGFHLPFETIGFALDPPRLVAIPRGCEGRWLFAQSRPIPRHMLAVAVRCAGRRHPDIVTEVLAPDALLRLAEDAGAAGSPLRVAGGARTAGHGIA